jgi:hypothetical protein
VLTTEVGVFAHRIVGEGLHVAFRVVTPPRKICGDLAASLLLGDGIFEQVALLVVHREAGDCRPTHVIVCHIFNVTPWPFIENGNAYLYERAPPLPTARA